MYFKPSDDESSFPSLFLQHIYEGLNRLAIGGHQGHLFHLVFFLVDIQHIIEFSATHQSIPNGYRAPGRRYLAEVARAADRLGFEGVLTPTGTFCEDAWLSAAALLAETERLKFLVAFRPGLVPPTLAAQQAATLQRFSGGRLLLNVVSGGEDSEQQRFGDWLDHDQRYARTAEFVKIVTDIWTHDSVDFDGDYYRIRDGRRSD